MSQLHPYPPHEASGLSPQADIYRFDHYEASGLAYPPAGQAKPKKRRAKERIELDPNQPPTTQGKQRQRVFVACLQCRSRKTRCDGARPACFNCTKRAQERERADEAPEPDCSYDPLPKRRGPDREPGARQRLLRAESEPGPVRRRRRRPEGANAPYEPSDLSFAAADGSGPAACSFASQRSQLTQSGCVHGHSSPSQTSPIALPHLQVQIPTAAPVAYPHIPEPSGFPLLPMDPSFNHPGQLSVVHNAPLSYAHYQQSLSGIPSSPSSSTSSMDPRRGSVSFGQPITPYSPSPVSPITTTYGYPNSYQHQSVVDSPSAPLTPHYSPYQDTGVVNHPLYHRHWALVYDEDEQAQEEQTGSVSADPSLDFSRETWWDALLTLYHSALSPDYSATHTLSLTPSDRSHAASRITQDIRYLFRTSNYWFSFFHIPRFFATFCAPQTRVQMQPALVLGALAFVTMLQSSDVQRGAAGRAFALVLRDRAQGALEASLNAGWVDEGLVKAAWLIAIFESCPFSLASVPRAKSSMQLLDGLIRMLNLTNIDSEPSVRPLADTHAGKPGRGCHCSKMTLGATWSGTTEHAPMWAKSPMWDADWSEAEIRREECRRLCWSAAQLGASQANYTHATCMGDPNMWVSNPDNFALQWSGESLAGGSGRRSVWALYDRAALLWSDCVRQRDIQKTDAEKAEVAMRTWLETEEIEEALNQHTCDIEKSFMFIGRETLFNIRMCISYEYQRYIPHVMIGYSPHAKANQWLSHQVQVAKTVIAGLPQVTGLAMSALALRPMFVFWFASQVNRALMLWTYDNSLSVALEVCKAFLGPIDYLLALFPCPLQERRVQVMKQQVTSACYVAGMTPPQPIDLRPLLPKLYQ